LAGNQIYRFTDIVYVSDSLRLLVGNQEVPLGHLDQRLLEVLLEAGGDIVSTEALREHVWEGNAVGEDALKQRIRQLRALLEEAGANPGLIETVRGKGYRLAAPVICEDAAPRPKSPVRTALLGVGYFAAAIFLLAIVVGYYESSYTPQRMKNTAVHIEAAKTEAAAEVATRFNEIFREAMVQYSGLGILAGGGEAAFVIRPKLEVLEGGLQGVVYVVRVSDGRIEGLHRFTLDGDQDWAAVCQEVSENVATTIRGFPKPEND